MKPFSLREFISIVSDKDLCKQALKYHNMAMKDVEKRDFKLLVINLLKELDNGEDINGWYFDTNINIVPDFDVLLFCENYIINIDLKDKCNNKIKNKVVEKFKKQNRILQLVSHNEYLNLLFIADENRLLLFKNNEFIKFSIHELAELLIKQTIILNNLISDLKPSQYIISPLNNVNEYLEDLYCLTPEQEKIEKVIMNPGMYGVEGEAGTGKTLVAFDLIKKINNKKILFIFPGQVKKQHKNIESKMENLTIISAKSYSNYEFNNYDVVIVDEAQRLYSHERAYIYQWGKQNYSSKTTIFFYHTKQSLGSKDSGGVMDSLCKTFEKDQLGKKLKLSKKIRSNAAIAAFTNNLFDLNKVPSMNITVTEINHFIQIKYFQNADDAKPWIRKLLDNYNYDFLVPTGDNLGQASSDQFSNDFPDAINTHQILGGECKKVVTYIDESIKYSEKGALQKNSSEYYFIDNELYVNMTRAEEKLAIAVINNKDIYDAINDIILNPNSKFRVMQRVEQLPLDQKTKKQIKILINKSSSSNNV